MLGNEELKESTEEYLQMLKKKKKKSLKKLSLLNAIESQEEFGDEYVLLNYLAIYLR
jgi:hypothetical protein